MFFGFLSSFTHYYLTQPFVGTTIKTDNQCVNEQ